jgi:hypothetical protein
MIISILVAGRVSAPLALENPFGISTGREIASVAIASRIVA